MSELLTLTTPVAGPTLTTWRVKAIILDRLNLAELDALIVITLQGTNGEQLVKIYSGPEAHTLLLFLNTANLAVKSLERRVLEKLVADGVIAGTISGSPD